MGTHLYISSNKTSLILSQETNDLEEVLVFAQKFGASPMQIIFILENVAHLGLAMNLEGNRAL